MEIKVVGPGCERCKKTEKRIQEIIEETGIDATVVKVTDVMEIALYGIFQTPAVVIDQEVQCTGKVPEKDHIKEWLKK